MKAEERLKILKLKRLILPHTPRALFIFIKYVLGYDRLDWKVHYPLCEFVVNKKGVLLDNEPRDHFKTTVISIGFPIWVIVVIMRDIRILLNHKVLKKSKEILGEVMQHFEKNELLFKMFGNLVGAPWGNGVLTVKGRSGAIREPTITAGAVEHEITSSHYDLMINDDLAGLKDMFSLAARTQVERYYKTLKFLRDRGKFIKEINVGTRWHIKDITQYILDKVKGVKYRKTQAVIDIDTPKARVFFKNRYTLQELLDERDEDPVMFETQRQNNPRSSKDVYI